jgi:ADP-ribosylglycohydrolase
MHSVKSGIPLGQQDTRSDMPTDPALAQARRLVDAGRSMMAGLALGDALGWPTEFKSMRDIRSRFGELGIQEPPEPALFTDDTQMTIAVARAVIAHGRADVAVLMERMAEEFVQWGFSEDNNRAPGLSCMGGVRNLAKGIPWERSGGLDSKGCGSAMRVAPIGFVYQDDPQRLRAVAIASSLPTHRHPSAIASAVGAAYLVKLALDGVKPLEMPSRLASFVGGMSPEFDTTLATMNSALSMKDEVAAMDAIGAGWVGYEAVPLALYCVIKYEDSWVDTVRRGANFAGDSDSIASIAGGIQALRLGADSIPAAWLSRLERRAELEQLGAQLAEVKSVQPRTGDL